MSRFALVDPQGRVISDDPATSKPEAATEAPSMADLCKMAADEARKTSTKPSP